MNRITHCNPDPDPSSVLDLTDALEAEWVKKSGGKPGTRRVEAADECHIQV